MVLIIHVQQCQQCLAQSHDRLTLVCKSATACQKDSRAWWSLPSRPPSALAACCACWAASPVARLEYSILSLFMQLIDKLWRLRHRNGMQLIVKFWKLDQHIVMTQLLWCTKALTSQCHCLHAYWQSCLGVLLSKDGYLHRVNSAGHWLENEDINGRNKRFQEQI